MTKTADPSVVELTKTLSGFIHLRSFKFNLLYPFFKLEVYYSGAKISDNSVVFLAKTISFFSDLQSFNLNLM